MKKENTEFKKGWWTAFEDVLGFLAFSDALGLLEDKGITKEDIEDALENNYIRTEGAREVAKGYLAVIALSYFR